MNSGESSDNVMYWVAQAIKCEPKARAELSKTVFCHQNGLRNNCSFDFRWFDFRFFQPTFYATNLKSCNFVKDFEGFGWKCFQIFADRLKVASVKWAKFAKVKVSVGSKSLLNLHSLAFPQNVQHVLVKIHFLYNIYFYIPLFWSLNKLFFDHFTSTLLFFFMWEILSIFWIRSQIHFPVLFWGLLRTPEVALQTFCLLFRAPLLNFRKQR